MSLKRWALFLASFLVPLVIWAVPRFLTDGTTFFRQMLYTDVLGRSGQGFGSVEGTFTYYLEYYLGLAGANFPAIVGKRTVYGLAVLLCIIGAVYYNRLFTKGSYKKIIGYLLWIFIPFLAFSAVRTKLLWYVYPVSIPLFMSAGILSGKLVKEKKIAAVVRTVLAAFIIVAIGYFSKDVYVQIREKIDNQQSAVEFQRLVQRSAEHGSRSIKAYVLYGKGQAVWNQQDVFMAEAYGDYRCNDLDGGAKELVQEAAQTVKEEQEAEIICFLYGDGYDGVVGSLKRQGLNITLLGESENYKAVLVQQ